MNKYFIAHLYSKNSATMNKNFRKDVGKKAFEVVKKQRGAIEKNIKIIKEFL